MAEVESFICDYDYMNESVIDHDLTCSICKNPLYDPLVTPLCGHIFCSMCIKPWLEINNSCPSCRYSPLIKEQLQIPNRPLLNLLNKLLIRCKRCGKENIRRGDFIHHIHHICPKANINCSAANLKCPWTGTLDQLDIHLKTCIYTQMKPLHNEWMATTTKLTESIEELEKKMAALVVMNNELKRENERIRQTTFQVQKQCNQIEERSEQLMDIERLAKCMLDLSAKLSDAEIKQILGEHMYPVIEKLQPNLPGKITGMLLEMNNNEILKLIASDNCLKKKVEEAVVVLEAHRRRTTNNNS